MKMLTWRYAHHNVVLNVEDRFCINYLDNFSWDIARTPWPPPPFLKPDQTTIGTAERAIAQCAVRIHGSCRLQLMCMHFYL